MYLSDIFEYMDASVMDEMSEKISNSLADGGEVMFFNMIKRERASLNVDLPKKE